MKFTINIIFLLLMVTVVNAQVKAPAGPQLRPTYIQGATAHLGNGEVIENSIVAFEEGKLTIVREPGDLPKVNLSNYRIINAKGKHIYPGLIAPNTQLGLREIGAVRATRDDREVGTLTPNVRAIIAYDTDSEITPTIRSMGILLAQIVPEGGRVQGLSSIVQLDAWNWEDAAYKTDGGIHVDWPSLYSYSWQQRRYSKNEKYEEQVRELKQFFDEAKSYIAIKDPVATNLKFEAMKPIFNKETKVYVQANEAKVINHVVLFAKEYDLDLVIVGGEDAWMVTDLLAENNIPVILGSTQSLPNRQFDDVDQPFKTPLALKEAGIPFCFSHGSYWDVRNLAFQAGQAVGYGLDPEDAVSALTLETAKILGIDETAGSLEEGKDATIFLSDGDILDMRTSKVIQAFIQGREIDLDNKQKFLNRKYVKKYGQ